MDIFLLIQIWATICNKSRPYFYTWVSCPCQRASRVSPERGPPAHELRCRQMQAGNQPSVEGAHMWPPHIREKEATFAVRPVLAPSPREKAAISRPRFRSAPLPTPPTTDRPRPALMAAAAARRLLVLTRRGSLSPAPSTAASRSRRGGLHSSRSTECRCCLPADRCFVWMARALSFSLNRSARAVHALHHAAVRRRRGRDRAHSPRVRGRQAQLPQHPLRHQGHAQDEPARSAGASTVLSFRRYS